jgi:hypothetical protein
MRKHLSMAALQDIFYTKPKVTTVDKDNRQIRDPEMGTTVTTSFAFKKILMVLFRLVMLGWAQWIETVHNQIHNWIGLDCQDATKAGYDPILYFFHSNIDRQLQAVIDHYGEKIFSWLSMTPQARSCYQNKLS